MITIHSFNYPYLGTSVHTGTAFNFGTNFVLKTQFSYGVSSQFCGKGGKMKINIKLKCHPFYTKKNLIVDSVNMGSY